LRVWYGFSMDIAFLLDGRTTTVQLLTKGK
jgi:hypothetical protein